MQYWVYRWLPQWVQVMFVIAVVACGIAIAAVGVPGDPYLSAVVGGGLAFVALLVLLMTDWMAAVDRAGPWTQATAAAVTTLGAVLLSGPIAALLTHVLTVIVGMVVVVIVALAILSK